MIRVERIVSKGFDSADATLEKFLNTIEDKQIITITQGVYFTDRYKTEQNSYTVIYRE